MEPINLPPAARRDERPNRQPKDSANGGNDFLSARIFADVRFRNATQVFITARKGGVEARAGSQASCRSNTQPDQHVAQAMPSASSQYRHHRGSCDRLPSRRKINSHRIVRDAPERPANALMVRLDQSDLYAGGQRLEIAPVAFRRSGGEGFALCESSCGHQTANS